MAEKFAFLSDEWIEAAKALREELPAEAAATPHSMKMNLNVTEIPGRDETLEAHLDTSGGGMEMELGHLDDADISLQIDWATAKAILIEGNPQAGMQAFMSGKIKVLGGDITKLMAMQAGPQSPEAQEFGKKLADITE